MDLRNFLAQSPELSDMSFADSFATHWRSRRLNKGAYLAHQEHPESAVFPNADGKLRPESCARIFRHYQQGESVESIARRYHRRRASFYRIVLAQRATAISQLPIDYMPNALFARKSAEKVVFQAFFHHLGHHMVL